VCGWNSVAEEVESDYLDLENRTISIESEKETVTTRIIYLFNV
jgi:hypothetical protein